MSIPHGEVAWVCIEGSSRRKVRNVMSKVGRSELEKIIDEEK